MLLLYRVDAPGNNFPSLHVANCVFASLLSSHYSHTLGLVLGMYAVLVALSTMLVKQHWLADCVGGGLHLRVHLQR